MHFDPLDSPGPEGILPVQFFRLSGASSPEKRLLLAVLEAALLDFRKGVDARTRRARRLAHEVDAWFAADDEGWACSFLGVCHALGLDASAVRTRLARWRVEARAPQRAGLPAARPIQRPRRRSL